MTVDAGAGTRTPMPKYEYDCPRCGPFADYRPLADYALPNACPDCGAESPRAALSVPAISTGPATPMHSNVAAANQFMATSGHGPGCRCCSGKSFKLRREDWTRKLL